MPAPPPSLPGVYWQSHAVADSAAGPGRPAFVGPCRTVVPPVLVAGWGRFRQALGDRADATFARAVRGYFANGGGPCVVVSTPAPMTVAGLRAALVHLEDRDDIHIVAAPGATEQAMHEALLEHCARAGDRFAILDAPQPAGPAPDTVFTAARGRRDALAGRPDAHLGALYAPWLVVSDGGRVHAVPPSGHVMGLVEQTDATWGSHRAPANATLDDAVDVGVVLTDAHRAALYPAGAGGSVNCLRPLPGRGVVVYGARTLTAAPTWRFLPVRRLALEIERWMTRRLARLTFETHDALLRSRVIREVSMYLRALYLRGALVGAVPEQAYGVLCDETNNPEDVRRRGLLVADVQIAPAVPGEYITLRLTWTSGAGARSQLVAS